jgi:tetratricopeptide (TPR) repeat protein
MALYPTKEIDMKIPTFIAAMALVSGLTHANEIPAIDAASNTMNLTALKNLSQQTQGYDHAYANYRIAIMANILGQRDTAANALTSAQSTLESLNQTDADNLALLASVYGMQIGLDSMLGASLGPKLGQALEQAQALEPYNPRVVLVEAISAFNTPVMFGGSMKKALDLSTKAIELYSNPCDDICWGHAEAYTWRGLAKQNMGDAQGAITDWLAAVEIQPDYGWARFLLQQNQAIAN